MLQQNQIISLIQKGFSFHQQGRFKEAQVFYEKVLKIQADQFDALQLLGMLLAQTGQFSKAVNTLTKALRINPNNADCYSNIGNALKELKRFDEAILNFDQAVRINPNFALAFFNRGVTLQEIKRFEEALESYDRAIHIHSSYSEAYSNRGVIFQELKRFDEALESYDRAIRLNSDNAFLHYNRGKSLQELKRFDEALESFDKAINIKPDYAEAYSNRGNVLQELWLFDEALESYNKAIRIKSDFAEAYLNLGTALQVLRRFDEALKCFEKSINIKPDYAEAYSNHGNILQELGLLDGALESFDKAIDIKSDYAEAYSNRGNVLQELRLLDEALGSYNKAISIKPDFPYLLGNLQHLKMNICDWTNFNTYTELISEKVTYGKVSCDPLSLLALIDKPSHHKLCSEIHTKNLYPHNSILGDIPKRMRKSKIRIGYFSADFRNHAVSFLTAELFETHNKDKFELIAFSSGSETNDEMRKRITASFDQFINVQSMSDKEVAQLSRELGIDIAIDLGGFTKENRTGIFAYRSAPIQLSYIGFLGTMGAGYFDYLIADEIIVPIGSEKYYSEKIIRLPSYQVNDRKRTISTMAHTKKDLGLPEIGFVFCCFNNNFKILPITFDGWMRILKSVDGSVLFLYAENPLVEQNLKKEAIARGVESHRIIFAGRIAREEYLARYQSCGLFLDTTPYNAGTTASDALWAGLPVLTMRGESFASRVASSILNAIHLPELITSSQLEYEALAIELATNPQKMLSIKDKLSKNRLTTPLFDSSNFTRHLEDAYMQIMGRYWDNLLPDHIYIEPKY